MKGVDGEGYRLIYKPGHAMARKSGFALEHRVVLFDHIGDGPHPCHWCGKSMDWHGTQATGVCVDHLDDDRLNNRTDNLVPACVGCNSKRGKRRVRPESVVPSFMSNVALRTRSAGEAANETSVVSTLRELEAALKERRFGRATLNASELAAIADLLTVH